MTQLDLPIVEGVATKIDRILQRVVEGAGQRSPARPNSTPAAKRTPTASLNKNGTTNDRL